MACIMLWLPISTVTSFSSTQSEEVFSAGKAHSGRNSARLVVGCGDLFLCVVQVTGGSSGIGKCLAASAISRGASLVTLVARNKVRRVLRVCGALAT